MLVSLGIVWGCQTDACRVAYDMLLLAHDCDQQCDPSRALPDAVRVFTVLKLINYFILCVAVRSGTGCSG